MLGVSPVAGAVLAAKYWPNDGVTLRSTLETETDAIDPPINDKMATVDRSGGPAAPTPAMLS